HAQTRVAHTVRAGNAAVLPTRVGVSLDPPPTASVPPAGARRGAKSVSNRHAPARREAARKLPWTTPTVLGAAGPASRPCAPMSNCAKTSAYTGRVQETLDVSNDVAAEFAGIQDGILDELRARLSCRIRLRGNQLTIE